MLLDSVLLNVSHILIRHAGITSEQASFSAGDWLVPHPEVTRSESEALELIRQLADRIRGGEAFATVAREFSEDPLTVAQGGYLGSQSAAQLWIWPDVLDALAQTPIGEVTRPLLTESGFQIFVRHPPARPRTLSGRRLVIGHVGAPWLQFNTRSGKPVSRTREKAWAIASQLQRDLEAHPETFEARVREFSEHMEAERGGDIGEWSSLEPSPVWLELERLNKLEIGQVSQPFDGVFGIEILQRTPTRGRATYAASILRLPFDPTARATEQRSEQLVLRRARELASAIAREPETFSKHQQDLCCGEVQRVIEGRHWTPLELVLRELPPGAVHTQPVLGEASQYWIVKRERDVPPAPEVSFELPNPARPDIPWFVAEDGHLSAKALKLTSEHLGQLAWPSETTGQLRQLLEPTERLQELTPSARIEMLDNCAARIRQLLSPDRYSQFQQLVEREFEHLLLAPF